MAELRTYELEVFEQTSDYAELRLSTGAGPPKTRGLDKAAIDRLLEVVERDYSQHAVAQKVFGAPQLRDLGAKLADFLDGDERWLTPVLGRPPGIALRINAAERLRHLPWELLAADGSYLAVSTSAPLLPVRSIGTNAALNDQVKPANRPLRVLFMATSPRVSSRCSATRRRKRPSWLPPPVPESSWWWRKAAPWRVLAS
ncbi:hypothetical protein GCM10029963_28090 [Micromonospora andamanensis]